ncbi:glycerophosphodiester phosphodiesterase family protein [Kaarinaea lacus]
MSKYNIPQLVAHRGYSIRYPENTLLAIEQAFIAGACFVECDVQLTRDGVPVLLHDNKLQRTTGQAGDINELNSDQLGSISAHFASRFGEQFEAEPVPSLVQLAGLLSRWPERRVFVEIKRASIRKFGREFVLQKIVDVVEAVSNQVILISFDYEVIQLAQKINVFQTGWVIEEWNSSNNALAEQLRPDYMFVDYECIPQQLVKFPETSWHLVLYEIDSAQAASKWMHKGVKFIETNDIGGMLKAPEFKQSSCHG